VVELELWAGVLVEVATLLPGLVPSDDDADADASTFVVETLKAGLLSSILDMERVTFPRSVLNTSTASLVMLGLTMLS